MLQKILNKFKKKKLLSIYEGILTKYNSFHKKMLTLILFKNNNKKYVFL